MRMFLKHPDRNRVKFTLILNRCLFDDKEWNDHLKPTLVAASRMRNFQTVLNGRPLVYTFFDDNRAKHAKTKETVKRRLDEIHTMLRKATHKDPYLVHFMHGIPQSEWPEYQKMGYDASTLYAHFGEAKPIPYSRFRELAEKSWASWDEKKYPHVPLLSAGWDNRPRYYNPVPWVTKEESMLQRYTETPTAEELAAHVKAGMDFVYKHQETCPAQSLMLYAWNEHDEGGWLCPTLNPKTGRPDSSRVKAVGEVIRTWKPPV